MCLDNLRFRGDKSIHFLKGLFNEIPKFSKSEPQELREKNNSSKPENLTPDASASAKNVIPPPSSPVYKSLHFSTKNLDMLIQNIDILSP